LKEMTGGKGRRGRENGSPQRCREKKTQERLLKDHLGEIRAVLSRERQVEKLGGSEGNGKKRGKIPA